MPPVTVGHAGVLGRAPQRPRGCRLGLSAQAIRRSRRAGVPRHDDRDELTIEGIASGRLVRIAEAAYAVEGAGSTVRVQRTGPSFEVTYSSCNR
jgi:hypothetical protein